MSEPENDQPQLPLAGAGARLIAAREAAGMSRADIAQKTRISERLITKMEEGDFASLPSRTYAIGFTRSYARAVGLNENEIVELVRRELGLSAPIEAETESDYEPGNPARVPSARFAWWLAFAALLLIAAGLFFWRSYYAPAMMLPSILREETPTVEPTFITDINAFPSGNAVATFAPSDAPNPAFSAAPRPRPHVQARPRSHSPLTPATPTPSPAPAVVVPGPSPTSTVSN